MIFRTGNPIIYKYRFLKRFGTFYELLIDLTGEEISTIKAVEEQNALIDKIDELKNFILLEEESIKKGAIKKTKTQKRRGIKIQKSAIKNPVNLCDKRDTIIDAFTAKIILPGNLEKDVHLEKEPKYQESIAEGKKMRRQNQEGQGLKILTPQQMLSRLAFTLPQLEAGNNSQKLKN